METYDTEGLITIQVAQLEKEKKEISERLRIIAKRIDHTERAYRKEERLLLTEDYRSQQKTDHETFEAIQQARREAARQAHQDDLAIKARLTRLLGDYHTRKEVITAKKGEEFGAKKAAAEKKIKEEKEKRMKAVLKTREEERVKKEKEERARQEKEQEEARLEAGLFLFLIHETIPCDLTLTWHSERLAEEERQREEEAAAQAIAEEEVRKTEEAAILRREARERERQEALETARLQQQREDEAEARRQARAAEKAAEKAGLQRKPLIAPTAVKAVAKEDPIWRRTPADGQPTPAARSESPAPAVAKYKPPIAAGGGGGWRARQEAKLGGGGSGEAAPVVTPAPAVPARVVAAQTSTRPSSPGPSREEPKKDDEGFQTVSSRATKEPWRPRRGRA